MEMGTSQPYDEIDMRFDGPPPGAGGSGVVNGNDVSPVEGSGSTSSGEDPASGQQMGVPMSGAGVPSNVNVLGKPIATNNFVTKLYQ